MRISYCDSFTIKLLGRVQKVDAIRTANYVYTAIPDSRSKRTPGDTPKFVFWDYVSYWKDVLAL